MVEFNANAVAFLEQPELNARTLVLAEDEKGEGRHLELHNSIEEATDQDRRLGQDVYCLVDETGSVHYGGIKSWSLVGYELQIRLGEDASRVLDAAEYRIHLPDNAAITTANQAMKLIVGQPGRST